MRVAGNRVLARIEVIVRTLLPPNLREVDSMFEL